MKKIVSGKVWTRRKILKYGLRGTAGVSLLPSLWLSGCSKLSFRKKPNIILVSIDTLRPDHLSCYGYKRKTSPNIDAFSAEGRLYRNCFSQAPVTGPSCSSFITGFLPHETNILNNTTELVPGVPTIAEALNQNGYKTYGVVSNYVLKNRGFQQGFDVYDDSMDAKEAGRKSPERIAENTTNDAIKILNRHTEGSFYMWLHYQDPHGPYTSPEAYSKRFMNHGQKALNLKFNETNSGRGGIPKYQRLGDHTDYHYYVSQYDGEIAYLDEHFGRLIAWLKNAGLYEESIVILTADHGEALGEYKQFFAHGHDLSNSQLHVPFIIKDASGSKGVYNEYIQLLDIAPTVFNAAGIKFDLAFRGRDILASQASDAAICSELNVAGASLIKDGLKLILYGKTTLLFDITKDPAERNNLAGIADYLDKKNEMLGQLMRIYIKEDFLNLNTPTPSDLTEKQTEKLRSLGYVD